MVPHVPQLALSVCRFAQKALEPDPQTVKPAVHVVRQCPAEHACPGEHIIPHDPQLALSVIVETHAPEQFSCAAGQ
jgi:hypothetical protein